jgi:hypothetical protein
MKGGQVPKPEFGNLSSNVSETAPRGDGFRWVSH